MRAPQRRLAGWVHRRRDHGQLIFLDVRDRHGITQVVIDRTDAPAAHDEASRVRPEFVVSILGEVAPRLAGTENPRLPTGEIELRATGRRHPLGGQDPALLHQRPRRPGGREPAPQVPLPRHPARADAAPPAAAQPDGPGDPGGPSRQRVRRGRDADPDQEHARGRPRFHRPEPAPAGDGLRAAPEPATAQAAADGGGPRSLLPDRPLLPRRGPARRSPARVQPARPRDELRRRGDGHGLRRVDGDPGLRGHRPGAARSSRSRSRCSPSRRRSSGSARTSPTSATGWSWWTLAPALVGPGGHAVVGLRGLRQRAGERRPGQGDRGARHGRRHPPGDRRADRARRGASGPRAWRTWHSRPGGEIKGPIAKFLSTETQRAIIERRERPKATSS